MKLALSILFATSIAPCIAAVHPDLAHLPPVDVVPDANHPRVQEWVSAIDWTRVPNYPPKRFNADGSCPPPDDSCWTSCWVGKRCTKPDDIVECEHANIFAATYDVGI